ncbi:hypothetical protein [Nocardia fluminea]|uniref:hypothetical protein n=1 Tax=Nocardia fluminea TaxID=134984 RepID=UPI000C7088AB|nr:hypothetical protein [Nocardia fluminea]
MIAAISVLGVGAASAATVPAASQTAFIAAHGSLGGWWRPVDSRHRFAGQSAVPRRSIRATLVGTRYLDAAG